MSIEVKQLTINTSISSGDDPPTDKANVALSQSNDQQGLNEFSIDLEEIKADILLECQRLIKYNIQTRRER